MSVMLVAYEACGCAAMALLSLDDAESVAAFRRDAAEWGMEVLEEDHESVGPMPCSEHREPWPEGAAAILLDTEAGAA